MANIPQFEVHAPTGDNLAANEQTSVQIFNNPSFGEVRTAGTPDNPLFCLADVCKALDLTSTKVVTRLEDDVLFKHPISDALGRTQQATFVNEKGLYRVILRSNKQEALQFQDWICDEVLPSIRRTGGYIQTNNAMTDEEIMAKALMIGQATIERQKQQIAEKDTTIAELAPKAKYADEVLNAKGTYTLTQIAKELKYRSAQALTAALILKNILYRQWGKLYPTAKYSEGGFFTTKTNRFLYSDGTAGTSLSLVVPKGADFSSTHN